MELERSGSRPKLYALWLEAQCDAPCNDVVVGIHGDVLGCCVHIAHATFQRHTFKNRHRAHNARQSVDDFHG